MKVTYSNQAVNDLQQFNAADRTLIAKKIHYLAENFEQLKQSKKVRELKGTRFTGQYRYTIARRIRAIFRIEDDAIMMLILRIGRRKHTYS
ncbi:MAG: type II toxin-antitoxin system RelE/ParE family toxin [Pseudomonadota bacterium]|nr:type II toxin-antitoxin system RelE/ParE family toxin [Pseudomonadota bacterium]